MPIYIDNRGKGEKEIAELLDAKHYPILVQHIESGDIVIEDIGIERKTINDLINTLYGTKGHQLWEQIKILKDTYKKSLLIIEGYINWDDKLLCAVINGIMVGWQIPVIFSTTINETTKRIGNIFDKYGVSKSSRVPPPAVRKAKTTSEIKWCMLQVIPHIGGVVAKRILEEVPELFTADFVIGELESDLRSVKGLNRESRDLLVKVFME